MPDLRLVADVFSPNPDKIIKYSGDHPSRVLKIIPPLLKGIFRITSPRFFEDDIKWDVSSDTIEFFAQWRVRDDKDGRTNIWIKVKVIGKQNKKDKKGEMTINIHPYMVTKLPYSNLWDKFLAKLYSHFFYGNQKRKYITEDLRLLKDFENELKERIGIR